MPDQGTSPTPGTATVRARGDAERALAAGVVAEDLGEHPVAVLSAAVLTAARRAYQESRANFARRAGLAPDVVGGAEDGTRPAWALPYFEFTALADAVSVLNPWMRSMFETAAACDLLLSCVLNGDQVLATDALAEVGSQDLARTLLRWAVTGELRAPGREIMPGTEQLLSDVQVTLLRERAEALVSSDSPDAWIGAEIVSVCWGEHS